VVDDGGRPVAGVDVSSYWSGNGHKVDAAGKVIGWGKLDTPESIAEFWSRVGQMEPTAQPVKTDADGTFRVQASSARTHHVIVMDADRARGGLGILPIGQEGQPITVKLEPLVRIRGKIRGPESDKKPEWTHVYASRAEEPDRPVDFYRVAGCGSFNADFSMLLPPGRYQLQAYAEPSTIRVVPDPALTITGTEGVIDLGTLPLSLTAEPTFVKFRREQAENKRPLLKDWIGQNPPPLFADDAHGVARDWQLGRSPGKWQLVEFWGMDCPACLSRTLPDLIRFQEEHADQADRFEIVTVFLDIEGKIRTIAQMDEALKPIIKHVWNNKPLPFPTLVDPTLRTCESWGLSGYGEMALINPEGKVVAGDIEALQAALALPK